MRDRFLNQLRTLSSTEANRVALEDDTRSIRYGELMTLVESRARQLRRLGSRRVGLALDNGIDWALWDLAMMQETIVNVPLPGFFTPAQLAHVVDQAGVDTLIGPEPLASALRFEAGHDAMLWRRPMSTPPPALPEGTHKITFTSGTSGTPKGVCLSAAQLLNVAQALYEVSLPAQVEQHLCLLPLATLLENVAGVYAPLLAGAHIQVPSLSALGWQGGGSLEAAAEALEGQPPRLTSAAPS